MCIRDSANVDHIRRNRWNEQTARDIQHHNEQGEKAQPFVWPDILQNYFHYTVPPDKWG